MNQNNILRTFDITGTYLVTEPIFEFTFLANPYNIDDPETRFQQLASFIRQTLVEHYLFGLDDGHTFLVEFYPAGEDRFRRQTTFGRIGTIDADIFLRIFQGMLQSDETLVLEGMRVTVQFIGGAMNHEIYGTGRTFGAKCLPQHLKKRGLIMHAKSEEKKDILSETKLCGILAILLLKDKKYLGNTARAFNEWIQDAKSIGQELGITDGICKNEHFEKLLLKDGFKDRRIIVFSINRTMQFIATGSDW